jgi:hypothetical protein
LEQDRALTPDDEGERAKDPVPRSAESSVQIQESDPDEDEETSDPTLPVDEPAPLSYEQTPVSNLEALMEAGSDSVEKENLASLVEEIGANPDAASGEAGRDASGDPTIADDRTSECTVSIVTPTLAELYAAQGLIWKAVEVLEQFLRRNPGNRLAKERLAEFRAMKNA